MNVYIYSSHIRIFILAHACASDEGNSETLIRKFSVHIQAAIVSIHIYMCECVYICVCVILYTHNSYHSPFQPFSMCVQIMYIRVYVSIYIWNEAMSFAHILNHIIPVCLVGIIYNLVYHVSLFLVAQFSNSRRPADLLVFQI